MPSLAEMHRIKNDAHDRLFSIPGVRAVGLGGKVSGGKPIGEFSIIVYIGKKKERGQLRGEETIPSEINGVKTDVVEWPHRLVKCTTLEGGDHLRMDLSFSLKIDGTLGCIARSQSVPDSSPPDLLLSCRHVLFITDSDGAPHADVGSDVNTPSCCGLCEPVIANTVAGPPIDHYIDAAAATLAASQKVAARIHGLAVTGKLDLTDTQSLPQATLDALANHTYKVFKYGQKTGLTRGYIRDVSFKIQPTPDNPVVEPPDTDQIIVLPIGRDTFAESGDSGSVLYNEQTQIVGLVWAGTEPGATQPPLPSAACQIQRVLDGFSGTPSGTIRIATNPPVVVYTVPGIRRPPPILERIHRDLARTGHGSHYIQLYGKHREEVSWLAKHSDPLISAWHHNDGTAMGKLLIGLIEGELDALPTQVGERSWAECVRRIAGALLLWGSEPLQLDVLRYAPFVSSMGGHSYQEILELLRAVATTEN
jgi:hypothetical protein